MKLSIGIEHPKTENDAYSVIVPAIVGCSSGADDYDEIESNAIEAISFQLENIDVSKIKDLGIEHYQDLDEYDFVDEWKLIDVEI